MTFSVPRSFPQISFNKYKHEQAELHKKSLTLQNQFGIKIDNLMQYTITFENEREYLDLESQVKIARNDSSDLPIMKTLMERNTSVSKRDKYRYMRDCHKLQKQRSCLFSPEQQQQSEQKQSPRMASPHEQPAFEKLVHEQPAFEKLNEFQKDSPQPARQTHRSPQQEYFRIPNLHIPSEQVSLWSPKNPVEQISQNNGTEETQMGPNSVAKNYKLQKAGRAQWNKENQEPKVKSFQQRLQNDVQRRQQQKPNVTSLIKQLQNGTISGVKKQKILETLKGQLSKVQMQEIMQNIKQFQEIIKKI